MKYAIDRSTSRRISAEDASWERHTYICPCCRTEVYRVGSSITVQAPHFRHMPGVADEGCENYYPGYYWPDADFNTGKPLELGQRLALYLRLDYVDEEVDWNLDLSLPKARDPNGVVSFYTSRGLRTIPLSTLMRGGKKEPVDNDREYYEVMASPEVCDQYKAMVSKPLEGLDKHNFNIFRFSENSGRRVDSAKPLYFDELYLAIFSMTLSSVEFGEFLAFPFQPKGDWRGFAFEVPQDVTNQQKEVIEQVLKRNIIAHPPSIQIAYPPVICKSPDGRTLVKRESELIFIVEGTLSEASLEVAVVCNDESENQSFLLSDNDQYFIIPTPVSNEAILYFPEIQGSELYLELYGEEVATLTGSVNLEFVSRKDEQTFFSTALNPTCSEGLKKVREGEAKLSNVFNPYSKEITILHRETSYPFWKETVAKKETAALVINQLLQNSNNDVCLNFSNFGKPAIFVGKSEEPSVFKLSKAQANRLDAFLTRTLQTKSQRYPIKTLISLKASVSTHALSKEDCDDFLSLLNEAERTISANSILCGPVRNELKSVLGGRK